MIDQNDFILRLAERIYLAHEVLANLAERKRSTRSMSVHLDLDQKYRPTTLDEVIGQPEVVATIRSWGKNIPRALLFTGSPGTGKCLGRGTLVLMFDGTTKKVEDVEIGDLLMGPDSTPRRVLSLASGREEMCRIVPVKGDSYTANISHILSLKLSGTYEVVNISIRDYLQSGKTLRERGKGWRTGVEFPHRHVPVDPYYLGIWLADGVSENTNRICKPDAEVRDFLEEYAHSFGLTLKNHCKNMLKCPMWTISKEGSGGRKNPLMELMRGLGVENNKHVPHVYMANSREVRLQLLAGLLDGDGSLSCGGYSFTSTRRCLSESVAYLSRSLGMAAYLSRRQTKCQTGATCINYRVSISGNVDQIPCRIERKKASPRKQIKDVTVTGISVELLGMGDYYGFEIDGDGLFLLGDFTVTHNTSAARIVASIQGIDVGQMDSPLSDYIEINCGEVKSAIEMVRDLSYEIKRAPSGSKKMYTLDEYQIFSKSRGASETLLKVLEECPPWACFALCSTDPERILPAIRSRCIKVTFKAVKHSDLTNLVTDIAKKEGVELESKLIEKIAESAQGSARNAVKELEKVIRIADPAERMAAVGSVGAERAVFDLVKEMIPFSGNPNWGGVAKVLEEIKDENMESIRMMILGSVRGRLLKTTKPDERDRLWRIGCCFDKPYFGADAYSLLCMACYEVVFRAWGGK